MSVGIVKGTHELVSFRSSYRGRLRWPPSFIGRTLFRWENLRVVKFQSYMEDLGGERITPAAAS